MMPVFVHLPASRFFEFADRIHVLGLGIQLYISAAWLDGSRGEELERIAAWALEHDTELILHGPYQNLDAGAADQEILQVTRRRYSQAVTVGERLRATSIVFHTGFNPFTIEKIDSEWLAREVASWQQLLAVAPEWMVFHLENVNDRTPAPLLAILERVASPRLKVCWDLGHFNLFVEMTPDQWLDQLGAYIGELHLHNNYGGEDEHRSLDDGTVDVAGVFRGLRNRGLDPKLTLENDSEDKVRRSLAVIRHYAAEGA